MADETERASVSGTAQTVPLLDSFRAWEAECPFVVAVTFSGWERGSDAALRDELKRIRQTGFTAVRVRFDRDNDIEKSPGMMNWRNPDRFFDSAQQAGLRVIALPGNHPHSHFSTAINQTGFNVAAIENVSAWLKKLCGQYREHPALLAWELEDVNVTDFDSSEEDGFDRKIHTTALIVSAFHTADPQHPIIQNNSNLLAMPYYHSLTVDSPGSVVGTPFWLDLDLDAFLYELDRPFMAMAQLGVNIAGAALPIAGRVTCGSVWQQQDVSQSDRHIFTMTAGKMTRQLLLLLAAGMKSIYLAQWKPARSGEYHDTSSSLVDWLDRITPQGLAAGRIAAAVEKYQEELWNAVAQPRIHILWTPENDRKVYIGASRVLMNANIPFGFITEKQLLADPTRCAPILFLPGQEKLSTLLLESLYTYAEKGGRVVADMPTGYLNEKDTLLDTRPGTLFDRLFGAGIAGMFNVDDKAEMIRAQLVTTTAKSGGGIGELPAFTENRVGNGRFMLVNLSLSRINADPALQNSQIALLSYLLGSKQTHLPGLADCLTFRRTTEQTEHLFLINDSNGDHTVQIPVPALFLQAHEVLDGTPLAIENNGLQVTIPSSSGCWLRLSK